VFYVSKLLRLCEWEYDMVDMFTVYFSILGLSFILEYTL
jgi:hypothetical protein